MSDVTILFTDIKNSTVIARALGDTAYVEAMRNPHYEALETQIRQDNGTIFQDKGDGVVAYFPTAADAVAAAITLQTRFRVRAQTATDETGAIHEIRARMGLHTGAVDPDDRPGVNALNYTARIESLADAGQIILSEATFAELDPPRYRCKEWPKRHLKSIDTLETVYELDYDGILRPEPGTRFFASAYSRPANSYVERTQREEQVIGGFQKMRAGGSYCRLVTLHAEGGMGKTRLAVTCATRLAGLFPAGVWFVPLAQTARSRQAVVERIALTLGLKPATEEPLFAFLHQSEARLLILDNTESVGCEETRSLIAELLSVAPELSLLATGREPLGLVDVEARVNLDEGLTAPEAAELFLDRTALVKQPPKADDPALPGLLKATYYIPLAIELLAPWWEGYTSLSDMSKDYLIPQKRSRLTSTAADSARSDDPTTRQRHNSMTHSYDWSWKKLGELKDGKKAQKVLAAASLFATTFSEEAIANICRMSDADAALRCLQRCSLIRLSSTSRYFMHLFTRDYAAQKLEASSTVAKTCQRFVTHYVQLVIENKNLNNAEHRAVLTAEWQNVLVAVGIAEAAENWPPVLMLFNLGPFLGLRGLWLERERLYLAGLVAARSFGKKQEEGNALNNLGVVYQSRGDWDKAEDAYQQNLQICRELGDRHGEGGTLNNLGIVYQSRGDWDRAEAAYNQSLVIKRELSDRHGEGATLNNLGNVYQSRGEWEKAEVAYNQSLVIKRELGDRQGKGQTLGNLGNVYRSRGDWDKAEAACNESLVIKRELGDRQGEGNTLNNLGIIYVSRGEWDKAEAACNESLVIMHELGDRHGEGNTLNNLGIIYRNRGERDKAEAAYLQDLQICRELGDHHGEGMTLENIALLMWKQGKRAEAIDYARQAASILEQTEDVAGLAKAQNMLAVLESEAA